MTAMLCTLELKRVPPTYPDLDAARGVVLGIFIGAKIWVVLGVMVWALL